VSEDRYSRRQKDKEDRDDQQYDDRLQYFVDSLKSKLLSQEDSLIESIIINSQIETWKFSYDWRTKAFNDLKNKELIEYTKDLNIVWVSPDTVIQDYIFYLKKRILLDLPEYKIQNMMDEYYSFISQKDEIKENLVKNWVILPEKISDIDLFVRLIICENKRKSWIKNLLSLKKSIDIKEEREIIDEIERERLKENFMQLSPKEKLLKNLWKERIDEFKKDIKKEKELWQIYPIFDIISYCIDKINKKYNFRFTEEEKNILTEIWQNYIKRIR